MENTCIYRHYGVYFNMISEYRKKQGLSKHSRRIIFYTSTGALLLLISYIAALYISGRIPHKENPTLQSERVYTGSPAITPVKKETVKVEGFIKRGDTIINVLKREGLDHLSAHRFFTDVKPVYNLKKIRAGKNYSLRLDEESGQLMQFNYEIEPNQYLEAHLNKDSGSYEGKLVTIPYQVKMEFVRSSIQFSLFEAILKSGEKAELADVMASLYEYDIDFNRDIRKGDSFALVVEKMYLKGEFIRYGHVLAAEFTNRGSTVRVIRYTDPTGKTAYYHPDGRSVRKMFLRCPLPFMRVTSRYGNRRHPLLGYSAKHNGIDLSAPTGTRIRATASGIIKNRGYNSGKGRFITIRHKNHYVTHYYHLSRFAKGIKPGKRIEQGQIIGYVGSTGWSTGPHLHYGLQKSGRFMNPLRLNSPTKEPVKKIFLENFQEYAKRAFLLLSGSQYVTIPQQLSEVLLNSPARPMPQPVSSPLTR